MQTQKPLMRHRRPTGRRFASPAAVGPWILLAPALIILLAMTVAPAFYLFYASFRHENLLGPGSTFVGLQNFSHALADPEIWWDWVATLQFVVIAVGIEIAIGLALALMLSAKLPERNLLSALYILPLGVAPVVSALVFRVLLNPTYGWIDFYLQSWGLIDPPIDWLGQPFTAWVAIIALDVWQWTPFVTLILLAALSGVPPEPRAAALLDGATAFALFWRIIFPFIRPFIAIAVVLRSIEAFKTFGSIFVLTGGGPGASTETINLSLYRIALQDFDIGAAAALGLIFLFLLSLVMGQLLRLLGRNTDILEN
jgi:multiple sugar transport system permease protein